MEIQQGINVEEYNRECMEIPTTGNVWKYLQQRMYGNSNNRECVEIQQRIVCMGEKIGFDGLGGSTTENVWKYMQ